MHVPRGGAWFRGEGICSGGSWFGGVSAPRGCLVLRDVCSRGCLVLRDVCSRGCLVPGGRLLPGGAWSGGVSAPRGVPGEDPPGQPLLQVVRILLECILVKVCMFVFEILLFAVAFECSKSISFRVCNILVLKRVRGRVFYSYFRTSWNIGAFSLCMFLSSTKLSEWSPMEQRAPAQGSSRDQCI